MKKIGLFFLTAAMTFTAGGGFVSCKDYEEDLRSELQSTKTVLDALKETVEVGDQTLNGLITDLQNQLNTLTEEFEDLKSKAATKAELDQAIANLADIYATKAALEAVRSDLQAKIDAANAAIATEHATNEQQAQKLLELEGAITACEGTITILEGRIAALEGRVDALESWRATVTEWQNGINQWRDEIKNLPEDVQKALNIANEAKTKAEANAADIVALQKLVEKNDAALKATQDSLLGCYNTAIDSINTNVNDLNDLINKLVGEGFTGTLADLQKTTNEKLSEHQERLDSIVGAISVINESIKDLNKKYDDLRADVLGIQNYLSHLITGVLVQGVSNPLYGTFALPTNTSSNVLAAYYGDITYEVEFPTFNSIYYANPTAMTLSPKDLEMLGNPQLKIGAGRIVNDAEDNAGTVYVTINPTNIDFTGEKLELVNSLDEAAGVTLSPLAKSEKKLTFGWSRAANNGFYEAKAHIDAANIENVKARINLTELKDALKDVLTPGNGINVTNVVTTLGKSFTNVLDANALKASWTVDDEDMAVYSHYALAATAIKPLSYTFLQDLEVQSIPGFGRIENLINRLFNKISVEVENAMPTFELEKYKFTNIEGIELKADGKVTAKTTISIDFKIAANEIFEGVKQTFAVKDADGNTIGEVYVEVDGNKEYQDTITKDVEVEVDITDMLEDIEGDINSFVTSINNDLQEINDLLDELNKINDISNKLTDATDEIQSEIIRYLDRLNNKLCSWINSANKALQPLMLVNTTEGFARLSEVKKAPSMVNSTNITLYPTSFTAEIIAPAYKKLVGVTNVYSTDYTKDAQEVEDKDCTDELNRINGQESLAKVVDGSRTGVSVSLRKGFVYEFAYTAVDYSGMVVARKYYISVK